MIVGIDWIVGMKRIERIEGVQRIEANQKQNDDVWMPHPATIQTQTKTAQNKQTNHLSSLHQTCFHQVHTLMRGAVQISAESLSPLAPK